MKRLTVRSCAIIGTAALCLVSVLRLSAQTTAPATGQNAAESEETLVLSPFVVDASEDADSYQAKSTLAGTRVRTELKDIASSISVVTKQFLQDTGSKNSADLLVYTPNTEVGGVGGNFSGNAGGSTYNEDGSLLRPSNNTRVRGLDGADNTRDYFLTEIPWDGYNVDRVDLQRGPNSILFGVGSPAGIINTSINSATFKNKNIVENRIAKFGSLRFSADFNYVLLPDELAIRVAALDDHTQYRQDPAYNRDKRLFAALRYAPKLFGEGANTSLRANYESGKVNANRPRTLPPVDAISPWFYTGTDQNGNRALNKFTYDASKVNPGADPFNYANRGAFPYAWTGGVVGRQFWIDTVGYYGTLGQSTPTAYGQPSASGNNGIGPNGKPDANIGGLQGSSPKQVSVFSTYMIRSGIPGGSYYADRSLSDPSVFDFYNNLIDGTNKSEWQEWNSSNVAFSQTFFNDRLGFEAVYDYQRYSDGQRTFLGNSDTYQINVDIRSHFVDGSPNPNVGRAYVANSDEQANSLTDISRDAYRFTAYGELRADDFMDKSSWLTKFLGRHVFTGLLSDDTKRSFTKNWATSAATPAFSQYMGTLESLTGHFRSYNYMAYMSGDLRGRSSISGAALSPINYTVKAPRNASVRIFDNHWAKATTPGDPNYVDPSAPYTYNNMNGSLAFYNGSPTTTSTQSENPANYIGWRNINVDYLNADDGDINALTYNAGRSENSGTAQAITWQGYLFDGALVPVFGWRKDKISNVSGAGAQDRFGIVNPDFNLDHSTAKIATGESKSWGAVLHIPAKWTKFIPGNTTFSVFFNRSENFKADNPRGDVFGNVIPNPLGETKEYGVVVNTLDDKLTVKATWYETKVANATLPGSNPLGQNSYYLWAVPVWGTAFAQAGDAYIKGQSFNTQWGAEGYANAGGATGQGAVNENRFLSDNVTINPAWLNSAGVQMQKAAIEAWRQLPVDQQFFNAYGSEVALMNSAAIKAGDWANANPLWKQKIDYQPISGGQLAGFGSGPVFTVDTLSKGVELELLAQPTKNWNVSVNASKTFATRADLAPTIVDQINKMTAFLAGPAGDLRIWGGWGGPDAAFRNQWRNNILNPYFTFKSQEGSNAPEISEWRFNAVTTYNFSEGRLKGSWIGGGYRYESPRVLGYIYDPKLNNNLGALDISKPWEGDSEMHFDMWIGHSRKLTERINWRVQVNLRNVGEDPSLVPVSINPDGTVAYSRIQEGMVWQLTNTLEF